MLHLIKPISFSIIFIVLVLFITPLVAQNNTSQIAVDTNAGQLEKSDSVRNSGSGSKGDSKAPSDAPSSENSLSSAMEKTEVEPFKQTIRYKSSSDFSATYIVKILISLLFVLGLAFVAVLFLKKFNGSIFSGNAGVVDGGAIDLIATKKITPRLTLYLVNVGGNNQGNILIAQSGDQLSFYQNFITENEKTKVDSSSKSLKTEIDNTEIT